MSDISTSAAAGRSLYELIWNTVQVRYFDRERLVAIDWAGARHRYDDLIVDEASALKIAGEMVALLGDKYTRLLTVEEVVAKREGRVSESLYAYNNIMRDAADDFKIGYIGISSFDHSEIADQVAERLSGIAHCDAFVVDVRGNGGGLLNETVNTLELFIDESDICFIERRTTSGVSESFVYLSQEHFVRYTEATGQEPDKSLYLRRAAMIAGKPMVVLIDNDTASSAEMFSAALWHHGRVEGGPHRIITMGARTTGKGIGQADYEVAPGVTLKISCMRFCSPTNEWFGDAGQTVANGVKPDIELVDEVSEDSEPRCAVDAACLHLRGYLGAQQTACIKNKGEALLAAA